MPLTFYSDDPIFSAAYDFSAVGSGAQFAQGGAVYDVFGKDYQVQFGPGSPFAAVEETRDGRSGRPFGTDLHREYVRVFKVMLKQTNQTSCNVGPGFVCRCPGLPVPFAPYVPYRKFEYDPDARAVDISAEAVEGTDALVWLVTVRYSTDMPVWGPLFGKQTLGWDDVKGVQHAPWRITPWKDWGTETFQDYPLVDLDGKPYQTAAGQPFLPAFPTTRGYKVVDVTRYEKDFETRNEDYILCTNTVDFLGSPPGYALCLGPTKATEMYMGVTLFHKVTYRVQLKKKVALGNGQFTEGFDPVRILNAGTYQKATFLGQTVPGLAPIVKYGQAVSNPVLLDENGLEQTLRDANGNLVPTYIERRQLRKVDLNAILQPQP